MACVAEDVADGGRDIGRRERGRGHLVEEGLEQVVVLAVHQHDADRRMLEGPGGPQPPNPPPTMMTVGLEELDLSPPLAPYVGHEDIGGLDPGQGVGLVLVEDHPVPGGHGDPGLALEHLDAARQ